MYMYGIIFFCFCMQLYIRRILISEGSSVLKDALKVQPDVMPSMCGWVFSVGWWNVPAGCLQYLQAPPHEPGKEQQCKLVDCAWVYMYIRTQLYLILPTLDGRGYPVTSWSWDRGAGRNSTKVVLICIKYAQYPILYCFGELIQIISTLYWFSELIQTISTRLIWWVDSKRINSTDLMSWSKIC